MTPSEKAKELVDKYREVLAAFVIVARHARNFPHPQIPIERLRSEAVMAEMAAERLLGEKEYDAICMGAFKDE
jgi:hypothetical protein